MVKVMIEYQGDLHCQLIHGPSGSIINTDAPKDNQGKGEAFSPTDLVAAALGSCVLTVMGIAAKRQGIKIDGARAEIIKEMAVMPVRRIAKLTLNIQMPAGVPKESRDILLKAANSCPVHNSLHADIQEKIEILYPD